MVHIGFQHTIAQGVRALEFLKQEVDAGIKPQTNHFGVKNLLTRSLLLC